jgi:hypothetical protein
MKKFLFLSIAILGVTACNSYEDEVDKMVRESHDIPIVETEKVNDAGARFDYVGYLAPVDGSDASGGLIASYTNGAYVLKAEFKNLPDPDSNFFYEGWLIKPGDPIDIRSTGIVPKKDGVYVNIFSAKEDFTGYTEYVLTLEPDDGNIKPDKHILEGKIEKKES